MRYKLLGNSGVRISEVALGTMTFGEDWGWGAPPEISARILDMFADAGGNVVDTADVYTNGTSETILGQLLKGRRDRFVLATKFTNQTDPGDPNSAGNHRKKIVASIEASLRRLQTDHIDLYWVHARDLLTPVEELMRALDDQVRLGKILYPAVSDWGAWEIAEANTAARLRDWSPFTAVQLRYNLLDRSPERELLPMAAAFDLPVFCWGPLGEGRLTGKYLSGQTGRASEVPRPYTQVGSDDIVREVVAISEETSCSPAQVALSWLRQQPGSVIPLIAARTEEQFRDNLAAIDVHLSQQHLERLDALGRPTLGSPPMSCGKPLWWVASMAPNCPTSTTPEPRRCAAPPTLRDRPYCGPLLRRPRGCPRSPGVSSACFPAPDRHVGSISLALDFSHLADTGGSVQAPGLRPRPTRFVQPVAQIRALQPDDWQDIRAIRLRSLADAPDAFTSNFSRESAYDEARWRELAVSGTWFVAADDELVGVAVGVRGWSGDPKDRELVGMWVAPSHRRRGLAKELLDRVKAWAMLEGATTLKLGVREGNEEALTAYLSMGMRPSGETMPEFDQPTNMITVMECDLRSP